MPLPPSSSQVAERLALLTQQEKISWERNGSDRSFITKVGDISASITANAGSPHPTLAVMNS